MPLQTRNVTIALKSGAGSESSTIGVAPARFAGMYLRFTPSNLTATVVADNMGRHIAGPDAGAADQHLDELGEDSEKLVNGDIVVTASGASGDGTLVAEIWLRRP